MLVPNSSANSRRVKQQFPRITTRNLLTWSSFVDVESRLVWYLHRRKFRFLTALKPLIALRTGHTVLLVCLVLQLKSLGKFLPSMQQSSNTKVVPQALSLSLCH